MNETFLDGSSFSLALDIGTRSLVAVVFEYGQGISGKKIIIHEIAAREHTSRAMRDGQIEDMAAVRDGVVALLGDLRSPLSQKEVAIAVAGRSLETIRGAAEEIGDENFTVDEALNHRLVSEALFNAAMGLEGPERYHGVGHVVTARRRNGEQVSSLLGQSAKSVELEVLATFLREDVVEGKLTVMREAGLSVESVSLEPVAVLNLLGASSGGSFLSTLLLDIGAGTTDMALSLQGQPFDFRMVPMAGDEVTERIARRFLLSFEEAERIKRLDLTRGGGESSLEARSVTGKKISVPFKDLREICLQSARDFAEAAADRLEGMNPSSPIRPDGVFLVGGGSRLFGLTRTIAERLGLPEERVFLWDAERIPRIEDRTGGRLAGPEMVTPAAIAWSCAFDGGARPADFRVGERRVRHLIRREGCLAAELIPRAGLSRGELVGRDGADLAVRLAQSGNATAEEIIIHPGERGGLPVVQIDNRPAELSSVVKGGEHITFSKGSDGAPARITAGEFCRDHALSVRVEMEGLLGRGTREVFPPLRRVSESGGEILGGDEPLRDGDRIRFDPHPTVRSLLVGSGANPAAPLLRRGWVAVDGERVSFAERRLGVSVNGRNVPSGFDLDDRLADGDRVRVEWEEPVRVADVIPLPHPATAIRVFVNDEERRVLDAARHVWCGGRLLAAEDPLEIGAEIITPAGRRRRLRLADVAASGIEVPRLKRGEKLLLKIDGRPASWDAPLEEGARVEMRAEAER